MEVQFAWQNDYLAYNNVLCSISSIDISKKQLWQLGIPGRELFCEVVGNHKSGDGLEGMDGSGGGKNWGAPGLWDHTKG